MARSSVQFSEIVPALFGMTNVLRFFSETVPETSKNYTRLFETTSWSTRYTAEPRREATNTALRNESFPVGPPLGDSELSSPFR